MGPALVVPWERGEWLAFACLSVMFSLAPSRPTPPPHCMPFLSRVRCAGEDLEVVWGRPEGVILSLLLHQLVLSWRLSLWSSAVTVLLWAFSWTLRALLSDPFTCVPLLQELEPPSLAVGSLLSLEGALLDSTQKGCLGICLLLSQDPEPISYLSGK